MSEEVRARAADPLEVQRVGVEATPVLMAIDEASFVRPWTRPMYESAFANDITRVFVLRRAGEPVAYCSAWLLPEELHISNLAVLPGHRRQHLGRRLLEAVLSAAQAEGAVHATLEVRRSNRAALALYESLGFQTTAVRRDYYLDPVEDALILWRSTAA
jgi:ribosomal-protein-alanine N-acetyltransferase